MVGELSRLRGKIVSHRAHGIEANPGTITMRRDNWKVNMWYNCIILLAKSHCYSTNSGFVTSTLMENHIYTHNNSPMQ